MRDRTAGTDLLLCVALAMVLVGRAGADECARTYVVGPVGAPTPRIDGVLGEDEWPEERWESELVFPWRDVPAPETAFILQTDGAALYFAFWVADEDIVVVDGPAGDESLVERGDRVELFFARDEKLREYYSIEIDPTGRVLDYSARFYRHFDSEWDCPGLEVAAQRRPGGYDVEGRLPRRALESMGLTLPSNRKPMLAGVFRAEFSHRGGEAAHESWISWIRPWVPKPDFHVPSAFGCLRPRDPR
jgi:hypothetical protein